MSFTVLSNRALVTPTHWPPQLGLANYLTSVLLSDDFIKTRLGPELVLSSAVPLVVLVTEVSQLRVRNPARDEQDVSDLSRKAQSRTRRVRRAIFASSGVKKGPGDEEVMLLGYNRLCQTHMVLKCLWEVEMTAVGVSSPAIGKVYMLARSPILWS